MCGHNGKDREKFDSLDYVTHFVGAHRAGIRSKSSLDTCEQIDPNNCTLSLIYTLFLSFLGLSRISNNSTVLNAFAPPAGTYWL